MKPSVPPIVREHADLLVSTAGGYLRNVIREPATTCRVCATPVTPGFALCRPCEVQRSSVRVADLVVPLVYAISDHQSGIIMRGYKDNISAQIRTRHAQVVWRLLFLGLVLHERCISRAVGVPVARRLTIPSLHGRAGEHPFTSMARQMGAITPPPWLVAASGAMTDRTARAGQFVLHPPTDLSGEHVLLLDDTWTTGAQVQSAAHVLRDAGAEKVSALVVGRWLNRGFGGNERFITDRLTNDYDPFRCPVTGTVCP